MWQTTFDNNAFTGDRVTDSNPADLQSEATRRMALEALEDLKAENVVQIDVRPQASFTDYMIFASGNSTRHVGAIADSVVESAKAAGKPPLGVEGEDVGEWILIDLGDAVVHVMLPEVRNYYELEKLWGEELSGG